MQLVKHDELGTNIRQLRNRDQMTQQELAEKSYLSQSVIARIEKGERRVNIEEFQQIMRGLGMTDPNELLYPEPPGRSDDGWDLVEYRSGVEPDDVAGCEALINWLSKRKRMFLGPDEAGMAPKAAMFVGPPGSGKTTAGRLVAGAWDVPLLDVNMEKLMSKYADRPQTKLRSVLEQAEDEEPCVLMFDEAERFFGDTDERSLGMLLSWIHECDQRVFVVLSCNDREGMPPELKRRGRLDQIFAVGLPDLETKLDIVRLTLEKHGLDSSIIPDDDEGELQAFEDRTDRMSAAECAAIVKDALSLVDDKDKLDWEAILEAAKDITAVAKLEYKDVEETIEWCKKYATWVD